MWHWLEITLITVPSNKCFKIQKNRCDFTIQWSNGNLKMSSSDNDHKSADNISLNEYIKLFCFGLLVFFVKYLVFVDSQTDSYLSWHYEHKSKGWWQCDNKSSLIDVIMWRQLMKYVIFHAYLVIASQCIFHLQFCHTSQLQKKKKSNMFQLSLSLTFLSAIIRAFFRNKCVYLFFEMWRREENVSNARESSMYF